MGENSSTLHIHQIVIILSEAYHYKIVRMTKVLFLMNDSWKGQLRSSEVIRGHTYMILSITLDRKVIEAYLSLKPHVKGEQFPLTAMQRRLRFGILASRFASTSGQMLAHTRFSCCTLVH